MISGEWRVTSGEWRLGLSGAEALAIGEWGPVPERSRRPVIRIDNYPLIL